MKRIFIFIFVGLLVVNLSAFGGNNDEIAKVRDYVNAHGTSYIIKSVTPNPTLFGMHSVPATTDITYGPVYAYAFLTGSQTLESVTSVHSYIVPVLVRGNYCAYLQIGVNAQGNYSLSLSSGDIALRAMQSNEKEGTMIAQHYDMGPRVAYALDRVNTEKGETIQRSSTRLLPEYADRQVTETDNSVSCGTVENMKVQTDDKIIIRVPKTGQDGNQMCWAGAMQSILLYKGFLNVSQCNIADVARIKGFINVSKPCYQDCVPCNVGNNAVGTQATLAYYGVNTSIGRNSLSLDEIKSYLKNDEPLEVGIRWKQGGAHALVLFGVWKTQVYYMDPWDATYYSRDYVDFVDNTSFAWVQTWTPSQPLVSRFSPITQTLPFAGTQTSEVTFSWDRNDAMTAYEMVVYGANNTVVVDTIVRGSLLSLHMSTLGSYSWSVRGLQEHNDVNIGTRYTPWSDTLAFSVTSMTDVMENTVSMNAVKVYPNPAVDRVTLESNTSFSSCVVTDALGNMVYTFSIDTQTHTTDIHLPGNLSAGVYLITLLDGAGRKIAYMILPKV